MSDIRFTNSGDSAIITTPKGNFLFRGDGRVVDPDNHLLMRDVDVSADQTELQKQIDGLVTRATNDENTISANTNRINGHDTVLNNHSDLINTKVSGAYGKLDAGERGYSLYMMNNLLNVCSRDNSGQDHWYTFVTWDATNTLLNNKVSKTGDDINGQLNIMNVGKRFSVQVDGNTIWYNTAGSPETIVTNGTLNQTSWATFGGNVNPTGMVHLRSMGGAITSNNLDIHMDDDGIVRMYSQNAVSNGFHQFLAFNPASGGNLDLYANGGQPMFNGQWIWHAGHMGSGSGLDADLLDGIDSSQFMRRDAPTTRTSDMFMGGFAIYNQSSYTDGWTRIQFESNNHITFINKSGNINTWIDCDGDNKGLHCNDIITAQHMATPTFNSWNTQTDFYYANRRTSFQWDGNTVWYGTDGASRTSVMDGNIWNNNLINTGGQVWCKDMLILRSSAGSSLNELDMHMDSDGCWRVYVQNAITGGFKQPINYVPTGNYDLYGAGGLFYNGHLIWHNGNMGSGSGLDADLLDGHDWSFFQSQIDNINNTVAANSGTSRLQSWGVDGGVATRVDDKVTLYLYYSTTANRITYPVGFKQVLSIQMSALMYDDNVTAAYIESYDTTSVKISAWARWKGETHSVDTAFFLTVVGTV